MEFVMEESKDPQDILNSLEEYFVDELEKIFSAYEKGDVKKVNKLASEVDRYCYAKLMIKKSSEKEQELLFEGDVMWKHYKKRFLKEGYEGSSIDILTAIFYWGLDKELKRSTFKEAKEVKPTNTKALLNNVDDNIKIFGDVAGSVLGLFFLIFNVVIGIVPAVWLILEGGWVIVLIGILFGFVSMFLVFVVNLPSLLLTAPFMLLSVKFAQKRNFSLSAFFYFISTLYPSIVISFWSIYIMATALNFAEDFSLLPLLLWSYIVALGPWMRGVGQGTSNSLISITVFACISYLISIVILLLGFPPYFVTWTFILVIILGQIVLSIVFYRNIKKNVNGLISHLL